MKQFLQELKVRYIKRLIQSNGYYLDRINNMNGQIQYWKRSKDNATVSTTRECFDKMVKMYLARYKYYINK